MVASRILLRDVTDSDLATFYEYQLDSEANYMAAFIGRDPTDREAFDKHWTKIRNDKDVMIKTILYDGSIAGSVSKYLREGRPEVTYWIGKPYWGKGIATQALSLFLQELRTRPIYAGAASDNTASIRVLEKNGFRVVGRGKGFANARGTVIEEVLMELTELDKHLSHCPSGRNRMSRPKSW